MAEFIYQAKNPAGETVEGKIDAPSENDAVNFLHERNFVILSLEEAQKNIFSIDISSLFEQANTKDIVIFTRQLATLLGADVPLVEGIKTIARQTEKESFKKIINAVAASVEGGAALSAALSEFGDIFSDFYISLVKAGEVSGKLNETLNYLADYLERKEGISSTIRGAMAYPVFVLIALVIVMIIMMIWVLPQLLAIISDAGVKEIPFTTRVIIFTTEFFNKYILLIALGAIMAGMGLFSYLKTPGGKVWFDGFKISIPRLGSIIKSFYISRFAETLSTLIKAGVPILRSLQVTGDVVGNSIYKESIMEAHESIKTGGTMSEVFQKYPNEFPTLVTSMLSIGEKTGRTDFMLENIFNFYKKETENSINSLSQLLEPVMIMILGIGVAFLVSGILLPIYSLVGSN
ncbi:MAG: hypothetical protein COV29_03985 [Candidatus Yanofskybacteria bacterium CG10_big_fil_rev_8_21_14_0_10_36_16]|uniref:Type II secretion system protein GspF domain-containing protein n=1 Tax=Candidatus Yanofskybacteria bacterium CG10_big_fil_rev_8_21_14_0_10_36_16 TaxID=1975096 RepID=A0A2J0Q6P6_9BACT|nr:MAG: hypothetical protein COV29_03985 [Candidatus Yanofskybacteria bacterium CG10_big_fil_rev_8_21_14_0_10_36_16]